MGHTGIYAFGDCVRRVDLGQLATVVELRIPCVYTWGASRSYFILVILHSKNVQNENGAMMPKPQPVVPIAPSTPKDVNSMAANVDIDKTQNVLGWKCPD